MEKPEGVVVSLGGQTAVNLAGPLKEYGVKLIGNADLKVKLVVKVS